MELRIQRDVKCNFWRSEAVFGRYMSFRDCKCKWSKVMPSASSFRPQKLSDLQNNSTFWACNLNPFPCTPRKFSLWKVVDQPPASHELINRRATVKGSTKCRRTKTMLPPENCCLHQWVFEVLPLTDLHTPSRSGIFLPTGMVCPFTPRRATVYRFLVDPFFGKANT